MRTLWIGASLLALAACGQQAEESAPTVEEVVDVDEAVEVDVTADDDGAPAAGDIDAILAAQSDEVKARYDARHPKETLSFFGVEPGMTVVDTLPGEVWYTGLLLDYLGPDGKVIGADYSPEMWTQFGQFSPEPGSKDNWSAEWVEKAEGWRDADTDAAVGAMQFSIPSDELNESVDIILMIRAFHHFHRLKDKGDYMTSALEHAVQILKPGGKVGVVQHRAPEDIADDWALGENGYVKQSATIAAFEAAGFELVAQSEVNANPKDQPTTDDFVWRLPPRLATSQEDPELRAQMEAIGESDRMTLLFKKPE